MTNATINLASLTPREREIIASLCAGRCNKRIARHLGISVGTVKVHLNSIYTKLGIPGRVALMAHTLNGVVMS